MVNEELTVKIGDFGLSRAAYKSDYYKTQDKNRELPIRWLGPECLLEQRFSTKSDVYSYGITLWEMATFGDPPYGVSIALKAL